MSMNLSGSKYSLIINPYESFMKKHLEHYGYFTGRNMAIARFGFETKRGIKNEDYDSESTSEESENSPNKIIKNKMDWKKSNNKFSDNHKWWIKDNYLVGLKELEYQREPRWPIEMQVIADKIKHIDSVFSKPEPFYIKTGLEETPQVSQENRHKTVFYYNPVNCGYFIRSRVGGNRDGLQRIYTDLPDIELDSTLTFESRFESGNLMKAIKISDTEYELYLRYDLYTHKHTQWFYFQIKNAKPDVEYRFTICNFLKSDSLYNMGMKPLMYSEHDSQTKKIGWRRWGNNIKYYRNNLKTDDGTSKSLYSLTWTCKFPNANDTYYFAHCYPYTYSDLQEYLKVIQDDPIKSKYCRVKVLCRSLAENLVHLLTITGQSESEEENANKKVIVLTARVHPGETNSSWMMKGFIDHLLGNSDDAKLLRDTFIFKIVPMLNPDGVIIGNYRCSLTGRDLNRNYKTVLKEAFPSIWHTREMIKKLMQEREVILYCDLHGHSRKNNVFIYGCHNNNNPKRRFQEYVFPMMLSKNAKDQFSYKSCKFKIQKSKQGTGRIVMWNMGIMNSFTMEATFSGSTLNQKANFHFNTRDLEEVALHFCTSLLEYCDPDQSKCKLILEEVENILKEQIRSKLESQGINVDQLDLINDFESLNINLDDDEQESSEDPGSDSSVDDGLPLHLERFAKMRQKKKRKTKPQKKSKATQGPSKILKDTSTSKINANQSSTNSLSTLNSNINNNNNISNINNGNNNNNNESINSISNATTKTTNSLPNTVISISYKEKDKKEKSSAGFATKQSNDTLFKETEKKLLKPLLSNNSMQNLQSLAAQRPKSSKTIISAYEEKIAKKVNPNAIQLQLDMESGQYQTDPNLLTFRYTLPNENHYHTHYHHQNNHLCEHHRKKLSDMFILNHIANDGNKEESDGNISDDEEDALEYCNENSSIQQEARKQKPSLEEYVKKHVLSRSESGGLIKKNYDRIKTSSSMLSHSSKNRFFNDPLLESKSLINKEDLYDNRQSPLRFDEDSTSVKIIDHKSNNNTDFLPKYILRQVNERRQVNPLNSTHNNNNSNSKPEASDSNFSINRKKLRQTKISSSSSTAAQYQYKQSLQQYASSSSLIHNRTISKLSSNLTNTTSNQLLTANSNVSNNANIFGKLNEEYINSITSTINQNQQTASTLYSSAFISMNANANSQIKTQYDKIATRSSAAILPNSNTIRQKIAK